MSSSCRTPVLLLIFNRPENTAAVFQRIREVQPPQLYVAADGPRQEHPDDFELCKETRVVVEDVDWDCIVHRNYRDANLGLRRAVSEAIDWFFTDVESGIVLEDDCVADPSFFSFCDSVLDRHRDNPRIMHITGTNLRGEGSGSKSYHFSRIPNVWGWATWRRAWNHYQREDDSFLRFKSEGRIKRIFADRLSRTMWAEKIEAAYASDSSWAFPWVYSVLRRDGLCIVPNTNLVTNVGFGPDATHARSAESALSNLPVTPMGEIEHPRRLEPDVAADLFLTQVLAKEQFYPGRRMRLLRRRIRLVLVAVLGEKGFHLLRRIVARVVGRNA